MSNTEQDASQASRRSSGVSRKTQHANQSQPPEVQISEARNELNPHTSPAEVHSQQRGNSRGSRPAGLPVSRELQQADSLNLQQIIQRPPSTLRPYLQYPWMSQQMVYGQQGPVQLQGQMPVGWVPYGMGYQMYEDQVNQLHPDIFASGQLTQQMYPYQIMFPRPGSDVPGFQAGAGLNSRPPIHGGPFFPQLHSQHQGVRGRPPRSSKSAEDTQDSYEFVMTEAVERPEQARRTLMLRNIPNKYTIHMLLEMLNKCHNRAPDQLTYDFCYLPIDFKNRCNLGYAFVNFVDSEAAAECYTAFNAKRWNDFNSKKVCEVKYARVQGKNALIEHFRNSKFPSNDTDCLPLLFELATDDAGKQIVKAIPLHSKQTN